MRKRVWLRSALWIPVLLIITTVGASAQSIELEVNEAESWLPQQTIEGEVFGGIESGTLSVGGDEYAFDVTDGSFEVEVQLKAGLNEVVACAEGVCSDTARWTLQFTPHPQVFTYAEVSDRSVELYADILEAPNGSPTSVAWTADPANPSTVSVTSASDAVASVTIPEGAPHGEYYFDLTVTDSAGLEGHARTFVSVDSSGLHPFDIWTDHAAWVDDAIVYEVTPYIFEGNGDWSDVTARLGEIASLGVNTLWIQPVFRTHGRGQGYDITNYFQLRTDLGSEQDLRELVRSAKEDYRMRVLFDFVPNHTSIEHRYAKDILARGESSPYYDLYLTEEDAAPYSQHYRSDQEPFIYYFWEDLVIIDWSEPEVYRWMMEAGQKWIEEFDIDGYRIDAVWGVNARTPEAMQKWRFDLKRIKPEIFLLGEDKATWPSSFEKRFDAAYDWYPEESWVSHWTWQTNYSATENHTIFNSSPEAARSQRLRDALTNGGDSWHPDAKVFRFMQNNDTYPFIESHGVDRTKMAASLLFALPGIPMIYNGQETGHDRHPYQTWQIFRPGESVKAQDPYGLYEHYQHLSAIRSAFPALRSDTFAELPVTPDNIQGETYSFRRWSGDRHVVTIINMGENSVRARIELPLSEMGLDEAQTYHLTDLLTGESRSLSGGALRFPVVTLDGYSTSIFMLADQVVEIPTATELAENGIPDRILLAQNYPNPFNPSTTIKFELPATHHVTLRVFDVLGREVSTLVDKRMISGTHAVRFDAQGLASGVYFYRLETGNQQVTRRMLLTK